MCHPRLIAPWRAMNEIPVTRPRVLLADDHQVLLQRVVRLLRTAFEVIGTAECGRQLIAEAIRLNPDVIVADISMPDLSGIEAARQLRQMGCTARVVFLTIHTDDEFVSACLAEGALGYVVKAHMKTDLIPAINAALSGQTFISPRN